MTTIGVVVSKIICLIKIRTGSKQTDRQTETGDLFFRSLGVMKRRENGKVTSSLHSGSKKSRLNLGKKLYSSPRVTTIFQKLKNRPIVEELS